MKRKQNVYNNICKIDNIFKAYNEVCKNTKNQKKINRFKELKCMYVSEIYNILINKTYIVGGYNIFTIYEPKKRIIVSQNMKDKIINHLVAKYILYPTLLPCLLDINVASRKGMGTSLGLKLFSQYYITCKIKYKSFYILKCDICKYFSSINHNIIKYKLLKRIKDKDAIKIVFDIIDSYELGLGIGSMTSQVLAIFYLNDLDHFIKENLKIKYYIRYQDDFLLFHKSKDYLKYCLKEITIFLEKEKLELNKKTRIYKSTDNFSFLGRTKSYKFIHLKNISKKIKNRKYLYISNQISLNSYISSIICYRNIKKRR